MISSTHRFIFLHAPKTGGNSVQTCLLPYSDDRMVTKDNQDGVDRFEINGPVTRSKHATLGRYHARLGERLGDYTVMITLRHPVDRALSMYFSPHRFLSGVMSDGEAFSLEKFEAMLEPMKSLADFLRVGGVVKQPDVTLRFEALAEDLAAAMKTLGLPPPDVPRLNRSADTYGGRAAIGAHAAISEAVERRFAEDYDVFGFSRRS